MQYWDSCRLPLTKMMYTDPHWLPILFVTTPKTTCNIYTSGAQSLAMINSPPNDWLNDSLILYLLRYPSFTKYLSGRAGRFLCINFFKVKKLKNMVFITDRKFTWITLATF